MGLAGVGISAGVGAAESVLGIFLAGHTARLKGATTENSAGNQAVAAFDADLQEIAQSVNNGSITPSQAIASLQQVDTQVFQYLKSQVGPAGTAWGNWVAGKPLGGCDKTCTVGCCIYNNDLHPAILNCIAVLQRGGGSVNVVKVYPSKYGLQDREPYTLTFNPPPASIASAADGVSQSIAVGLGIEQPTTAVSSNGSPLSASSPTTKLLLFGAVILGGFAAFCAIFKK